jgi:hypothetical protein
VTVHIVAHSEYSAWNGFRANELSSLCGTVIQRAEGKWHEPWTEFPCDTNPDKVCPACRDHPEYAMMLLAGDNLYE